MNNNNTAVEKDKVGLAFELNEVLYRNAFERAFSEVMALHRRPQTT